jgi:hypothetical protein
MLKSPTKCATEPVFFVIVLFRVRSPAADSLVKPAVFGRSNSNSNSNFAFATSLPPFTPHRGEGRGEGETFKRAPLTLGLGGSSAGHFVPVFVWKGSDLGFFFEPFPFEAILPSAD